MKKLLSLIIASAMCASVCATPASAVFGVTCRQAAGCGVCAQVHWDGNETVDDWIGLYRLFRRSRSVSRKVNGTLVARNDYFGDKFNTMHIPGLFTLAVKKAHKRGTSGQIVLDSNNGSLYPSECVNLSVSGVANYCWKKLDFPQKAVRRVDRGFKSWFMRSWI
jgi:hypothetical protein